MRHVWHPFEDGKYIGPRGSEQGTIIRDEQRRDGAHPL
jgi:hypothetical protein